MSWTKKNVHPGKIVSTSQEVEVMVLDVDSAKRRISLGLKQVQRNPWEQFVDEHPIGSVVEGEIRNITEFGLFIGLSADIDGMVHMSDISWDEPGELAMAKYNKGQMVKAKVLDVDVEKERISLGIKQLRTTRRRRCSTGIHKGDVVTCVVTAVQSNGIEVKVDDVLTGFIRRAELARDKARPAAGPVRGGREGRRQDHRRRPRGPQAHAHHQGQGSRGREAGDGRVRLVRFRRLAGRHPGRGDPAAQPAGADRAVIERDRSDPTRATVRSSGR